MSTQRIHLRYDGPAVANHTIDVSVLAPSLLAFNELLRELNSVVNGDKAKVKLNIKADIEANCVTLELLAEFKNVWEQVKGLLSHDDVVALNDLLAWLIAGGTAGGFLLRLVAKRDKRTKVERKEADKVRVTYQDGTVDEVTARLFEAVENPKVVIAVKKFTRPTTTDEGIDRISIYRSEDKNNQQQHTVIDQELGKQISEVGLPTKEGELAEVQYLTGHITIYQPTLDTKSKKWKFRFNGGVQTFDVSETDIPATIMQRGKVVVGDTFKVGFEVTEKKTEKGYTFTYKVKEVLEFTQGKEQQQLRLSSAEKPKKPDPGMEM